MARKIIPDSFNGYLKVNDEQFVFSISDHMVTLLPAQSDNCKKSDALFNLQQNNNDSSEFIVGDYSGSRIAMLKKRRISIGLTNASFFTPLIIKEVGNTNEFYNKYTDDWTKFHAITFFGGNINTLFSPKNALIFQKISDSFTGNEVTDIRFKSSSEYSHNIECIIGKEKCQLTITIIDAPETNSKSHSFCIGQLDSCLRVSFDNAQGFDTIEKYYRIIYRLMAIIIGQNNIQFGLYLSQKTSDGKYFKTAHCKLYSHYQSFSTKTSSNVIPLHSIMAYIPDLIKIVGNNDCDALLDLLPDDNKNVNKVSITDVQNICTVLEVAYSWKGKKDNKRPKDQDMEELRKRIKETIKQFNDEHTNIEVSQQTTIKKAFEYLDFTLKQKVTTLLNEHSEEIDEIIKRRALYPLDEKSIDAFIKLRNGKTHGGVLNLGDEARIYPALFALVYSCLFKYIGIPSDEIKALLPQIV